MLSRVVLSLLALSSVLLGVSAQTVPGGSPTLFCAPVTIDLFSVAVSATADTEGTMLAEKRGVYQTLFYTINLAQNYPGPSVFFNIAMQPNVSSANYPGLTTYGFTISLNGVFSNATGNSTFYDVGLTGDVTSIEFKDQWLSNIRSVEANVVLLNVTEFLTIPDNTTGLMQTTQCDYPYEFVFNNPIGTASTGANVVGDPQFKGLRGQSFQVHGVDGAVYNLISDANMQLNTRFTFLEGPRPCPVMPSTGKVSAACWSHPGSYLSELALKTSGGSQLSIVAGEASQGFSSIQLDGKTMAVGSSSELSFSDSSMSGSLTVDSTHELTIRSGLFELVVESNDGFVNLRSVYVSAANWPKLAAHGLLGQTWQNKRWGGKIKEIEGDVDDYLIEDDNLFGDNFLFNKF